MILRGKAVVVEQANVDTDVLYPGAYLNITDVEAMKSHLFEGLDPSLLQELEGDTVLVVGENFGVGSSREHVPQAMKGWGIKLILGRSFARIFYRNCLNLGLPAVIAPEAAAAARRGSLVEYDAVGGTVSVDGQSFSARPMPPFLREMIDAGGLVEWTRSRTAADRAASAI